ncbi:hypothetical protein Bbelb_103670 [Branchiostoma belcheri]|nr:hypothetical protein Bbelb_103670 [Branchiostoma belcheri]
MYAKVGEVEEMDPRAQQSKPTRRREDKYGTFNLIVDLAEQRPEDKRSAGALGEIRVFRGVKAAEHEPVGPRYLGKSRQHGGNLNCKRKPITDERVGTDEWQTINHQANAAEVINRHRFILKSPGAPDGRNNLLLKHEAAPLDLLMSSPVPAAVAGLGRPDGHEALDKDGAGRGDQDWDPRFTMNVTPTEETGFRFESNSTAAADENIWTAPVIQRVTTIAVIMFMALVGNGFIITVLTTSSAKQRFSRVNIFILNLAIGDLCVCVVTMSTEIMFVAFGQWVLGAVMCKLVVYGQIVTLASTTFILTGRFKTRQSLVRCSHGTDLERI